MHFGFLLMGIPQTKELVCYVTESIRSPVLNIDSAVS